MVSNAWACISTPANVVSVGTHQPVMGGGKRGDSQKDGLAGQLVAMPVDLQRGDRGDRAGRQVANQQGLLRSCPRRGDQRYFRPGRSSGDSPDNVRAPSATRNASSERAQRRLSRRPVAASSIWRLTPSDVVPFRVDVPQGDRQSVRNRGGRIFPFAFERSWHGRIRFWVARKRRFQPGVFGRIHVVVPESRPVRPRVVKRC